MRRALAPSAAAATSKRGTSMKVWIDIRHGGNHDSGYHWLYSVIDAAGKCLMHGDAPTQSVAMHRVADYVTRCGYENRGPWHARKAA